MENKVVSIFLSNIEELLEERNITKVDFCNAVELSRNTFINWKKQNCLPTTVTFIKIANYFNVSPEWLITGEITLPKSYDSQPNAIFNRIYQLMLQETKIPDLDYHQVSEEQREVLWNSISDIVSPYQLSNWQFNRSIPSYEVLQKLAKHFHREIEYIAEGKDNRIPAYIEKVEVPKEEYKHFEIYKEYKEMVWSYDQLYEPDKKYISQLIARMFRLKRFAEKTDYDYDYNRNHPLEKIPQRDPNISDEEYAKRREKNN